MIFFQKLKNRFSCTTTKNTHDIKWNIQNFKSDNSLEIFRYQEQHNKMLDLEIDGSCKLSENFNLYKVGKNGEYIQFIKDPSEDVQIAAVTQNRNAIQYINDPSHLAVLIAKSPNSSISSNE
jgi:hypothetical protein